MVTTDRVNTGIGARDNIRSVEVASSHRKAYELYAYVVRMVYSVPQVGYIKVGSP
jgi:hypothetical protein